jgi:hypothetical protein
MKTPDLNTTTRRMVLVGIISGFLGAFFVKLRVRSNRSVTPTSSATLDDLSLAYVDIFGLVSVAKSGAAIYIRYIPGLEVVADSADFQNFLNSNQAGIKATLAKNVRELFTRDELAEIVAFYSSPAGKKLQERYLDIYDVQSPIFKYNRKICYEYLMQLKNDPAKLLSLTSA